MTYLLNLFYLVLFFLFSPWLLVRIIRRGRYRRGLASKFMGRVNIPATIGGPTVWFHGVSVGEIHLLRQVIALARQRNPGWRIVVSVSTDTGYDEATKAFTDLPVVFWPFDFSWAVKTALDRIRPDLVVLAEGELWPNFFRIASSRGIKLAVLNGRMSPRSFGRFRKVAWLARRLLSSIDLILAQTDDYADRYRTLGARRVEVTGSVKYDGAATDRNNAKTRTMRELLGIADDALVWVAGSTQAPEEELVLAIYHKARKRFPGLRLILVPRQQNRFDGVADLLARSGLPFVRRSQASLAPRAQDAIWLVDTFGELSAVWGLADVAFVGGSLDGQRGGQNMIEPAAYGAAVTFGPHVWNFQDTVTRLLKVQGAIQMADAAALEQVTVELLGDAAGRQALGGRARAFVLSQQGATVKSIEALERLLAATMPLAA